MKLDLPFINIKTAIFCVVALAVDFPVFFHWYSLTVPILWNLF